MDYAFETMVGNKLGFDVALTDLAPRLVAHARASRFYEWLTNIWEGAPNSIGDAGSQAWASLYAEYADRIDAAFMRPTITYGKDEYKVDYKWDGADILKREFEEYGPENIWGLQDYRFAKTADDKFLTLVKDVPTITHYLYTYRPTVELFQTVASTQLNQVFELLDLGVPEDIAFACAGHTESLYGRLDDSSERSLRVKLLANLGCPAEAINILIDADIDAVTAAELYARGVPLEYMHTAVA